MRKLTLLTILMLSSVSALAGTVSLNLTGLEDLGPNARYEGWLITSGGPVTTGVFSVDGSGTPSQTDFAVDDADIIDATLFVLTIEPFPDANPAPAATHILAGDFAAGNASVTVAHTAALGDDFTATTGEFILAAPSDTNAVGSYRNGIWFLTPPTPVAGLSLPALPAGWIYEGWVVDINAGTPISTGTFTSASTADSDAGGSTAGPGGTPPFPGQDFINPLRDLTVSHMAVISIEPVPDNSPMPFTMKPLVKPITDPGDAGITQAMSNNATATNPSGSVSVMTGGTGAIRTSSVPGLGLYAMLLLILSTGLIARKQFQKS